VSLKGEATRQRIVDTARRLFRHQGYNHTSVDDICRESNVKKGNLYFYFSSKEELARAAIRDALDKQMPFFEALMQDETDPLRKVELMIDGVVAYHVARGCRVC
jgi:AcrR family transcriptional regulator